MTLANKAIELEYIDEFIQVFNLTNHQHDILKRISDTTQEKPDALCLLNDRITVGLETTFIMRRVDTPHIELHQQSLYLEFDRAFLFKGICCDADLLEFRT
ncbi:MAG: hypothetical protein KatS3mg087_0718 [Patescibacteria group bacterium]|nr:MAG: hypothetical protein KatS3mg087_0718 [Patescibacteria group bacterium]